MSDQDRQKWNARFAAADGAPAVPHPFLVDLGDLLPTTGAGLDVAAGAGRNGLWLAGRGLAMTLVDISSTGLDRAAATAAETDLKVTTIEADLETDPLPMGPWDLIVVCDYLWRELVSGAAQYLRPGGWLVYIQATKANATVNASPSARYLLEDGELPRLVRDLEIVRYQEGWLPVGGRKSQPAVGMPAVRHEARLAVRRVV